MDSEKFYRVVSREVFERIPFDGIVGEASTQRVSLDGSQFIVERAANFTKNARWISHAEAIELVLGPEWISPNRYPQDGEA